MPSKPRYISWCSAKEQFTFTHEYAACFLLGHNLNHYHHLHQQCLIWMNITLFTHSRISQFSAWTLLNRNYQFQKVSVPVKKHLSPDFPVIFSYTLASLNFIKMFTKMICIFLHKHLYTRWDQANINISKHYIQQCFTFILMVYQMFISHGVVHNMGLTPQ